MRRSATHHPRRSGPFVCTICLALVGLVAGCGGGSTRSTETEGQTATDTSSESTGTYSSPLAEFFGLDDASHQQDDYETRERARQEWIATCMAEQGFEYQYPDAGDVAVFFEPEGDGLEPGSREWAEICGFGISTQAFDQRTVGPDLVGYASTDSGTVEAQAETGDGYLDGLSEEERNAYYAALFGDDQGVEWDDSLSEAENQAAIDAHYAENPPSGCENQSYEQPSFTDPFQRLYEDFGDELSSMYERVLADPEIVAALDDVARCTTDAGFAYVDEQSTYDDIYRRLEPVNEEMSWPGDELTEAQLDALSDEERNELFNRQPELSAEGKAILAEIQRYEIDLALAFHDCGGGDLIDLYQQVSTRLEQEFIDAHRAELEAYKAE